MSSGEESERRMTLRHGTKKDYNKLVNGGVDGALSEFAESSACVVKKKPNKQQQTIMKKSKHQREFEEAEPDEVPDEEDYDADKDLEFIKRNSGQESEEDSDGYLREAEMKLQLLRKQHKQLQKQAKRARVEKETADLEKSLNALKKGKSKEKTVTVTSASLRAMDDVVDEVDKLMDQHMSFRTVVSESESSDIRSDVIVSGKKPVRKAEQVNRAEKKSGKSKNLLDSDCEFPQKWPHNFLNPHFVNCKDKKAYEDLSMGEFCAAYMAILEKESDDKLMHKIAHLKELMYLSTRYKWRSVLDYHGACLLEIERGQLKWGESFQLLQCTTLAGGMLVSNNRGGAAGFNTNRSYSQSGAGNSGGRSEGVVFCKGYQRGTCQQLRDHYGQFYGENRLLKHICANCWLNSKTQVVHPETSDECPLKVK